MNRCQCLGVRHANKETSNEYFLSQQLSGSSNEEILSFGLFHSIALFFDCNNLIFSNVIIDLSTLIDEDMPIDVSALPIMLIHAIIVIQTWIQKTTAKIDYPEKSKHQMKILYDFENNVTQ